MKLPQINWKTKDNIFLLLSILASSAYFVLWSTIDYLQYISLNLHIWDVGINFFIPYQASQLHFSNWISFTSQPFQPFQPQKLDYLLMVPIVKLFPNPFAVILAQLFIMSLAGPFVFLVARRLLNSNIEGLLIAVSYLFNYALFGAAFFPNHYSPLFSPFFVMAVYYRLSGRRLLFSTFLALAAMASLLGALTVAIFLLLVSCRGIEGKISLELFGVIHSVQEYWRKNVNIPILLLLSVGILIGSYLYFGSSGFLSGGHIQSTGNISEGILSSVLANLTLKVLYFALLLIPFGFVIFYSRYSILLVPFTLLVVITSFSNYMYFDLQYTYLIGTILFIAYSEGLSEQSDETSRVISYRSLRLKPSSRKRNLATMLLIVFILDLVVLPYGPLNQYAGGGQSDVPFANNLLGTAIHPTTNDMHLLRLMNMIPMNASVLMQENMPQLTNRQLWYEPGMYNGTPSLDYILTDPSSPFFASIPPNFIGPYPRSMESWVNELISQNNYGTYAYTNGDILLKLGYNGQPIVYVPYDTAASYKTFINSSFSYAPPRQNFVSISNQFNSGFAFSSQKFVFILPPGNFTLTFLMSTSNNSVANSVAVGLYSPVNGGVRVASHYIHGSDLYTNNRVTTVSFRFEVHRYYEGTYFTTYYTNWHGNLNLYGAYLNQTSV